MSSQPTEGAVISQNEEVQLEESPSISLSQREKRGQLESSSSISPILLSLGITASKPDIKPRTPSHQSSYRKDMEELQEFRKKKVRLQALVRRKYPSSRIVLRKLQPDLPYCTQFDYLYLDGKPVENYLLCKICKKLTRYLVNIDSGEIDDDMSNNRCALYAHSRGHIERGERRLYNEMRNFTLRNDAKRNSSIISEGTSKLPSSLQLNRLLIANSSRTRLCETLSDEPYSEIFNYLLLDGELMKDYLVCQICNELICLGGQYNVSMAKCHWGDHLRKGHCSCSNENDMPFVTIPGSRDVIMRQQLIGRRRCTGILTDIFLHNAIYAFLMLKSQWIYFSSFL